MVTTPLKLLLVALCASCLGSAKVQSPAPSPEEHADPFDPWRACTKALPKAVKGDPVAIHTIFLAADVQSATLIWVAKTWRASSIAWQSF